MIPTIMTQRPMVPPKGRIIAARTKPFVQSTNCWDTSPQILVQRTYRNKPICQNYVLMEHAPSMMDYLVGMRAHILRLFHL